MPLIGWIGCGFGLAAFACLLWNGLFCERDQIDDDDEMRRRAGW